MDSELIKINIRQGSETNMAIETKATSTVLEVKEQISKKLEATPLTSEMKLIFKGKILKDGDSLKDAGVATENTLHLVVTKPQQANTTQAPLGSQPNPQAGLGGMGGMGGLGGLGGMGGMGGFGGIDPSNIDPQQMSQMLSNPQVQATMQQMFSNPEMLQQMISSNPMLQQMVNNNPQMQQMFQDPVMLQMLSNPQYIQMMLQQQGGLGGAGGLGGLGGAGGAGGLGAAGGVGGAAGTSAPQQPPFNLMSMLNNCMIMNFIYIPIRRRNGRLPRIPTPATTTCSQS